MINYLLKRLLGMGPVLLGVTILSFAIIHLAPGKFTTVDQALNPKVSPEYQQRLIKLYDLDKPLHVQYILWLKKMVCFNFGQSFIDQRPVMEKIVERFPVTVGINILSLIFVFLVGIPVGIKAATKAGQGFDTATTYFAFFLFSAPTFWLALLLMQFFCIKLGWLPISGIRSLDFEYFSAGHKVMDIAWHLALPVFVSSL
jgi:peptide/nickel transport system permease protein